MVVLGGRAVSYERGTPVVEQGRRERSTPIPGQPERGNGPPPLSLRGQEVKFERQEVLGKS